MHKSYWAEAHFTRLQSGYPKGKRIKEAHGPKPQTQSAIAN